MTTHDPYRATLEAALRAPSPHNVQPWRLRQVERGRYDLDYLVSKRLLLDPDDRDGLLAMGAFYETLAVAASSHGLAASFAPVLEEADGELRLGSVRLVPDALLLPDELAGALPRRQTNRHPYSKEALPGALRAELEGLGCRFAPPAAVAKLVGRAGVMAWGDRRFLADLREWTRFGSAPYPPDGLDVDCLNLSALDQRFMRLAMALGRLPAPLGWAYSLYERGLTAASSEIIALDVPDLQATTLFEAGRRLLRAWLVVTRHGYSHHPMSIVIDQATAPELAGLLGVRHPVAVFRVGYTGRPTAWSQRLPLERVLTPAEVTVR